MTTIFRTNFPYELDIAIQVLKENEIPYLYDKESGTRPIRTSLGHNNSYELKVPEELFDPAMELLEQLPIDIHQEPKSIQDMQPPELQKANKFYAWVGLIITSIIFFMWIKHMY